MAYSYHNIEERNMQNIAVFISQKGYVGVIGVIGKRKGTSALAAHSNFLDIVYPLLTNLFPRAEICYPATDGSLR
jgi:hypothetical protein